MYEYVTDMRGVSSFVAKYQKYDELGFDTETTGLNPFLDKLLLVQVRAGETTFIFDCRKLPKTSIVYLAQLLKDSGKLLIGHNIKFDLKFMYTHTGELLTNVYDTMLAEILIRNGVGRQFYSLADLTEKYLGVVLDKSVRASFYETPDQEITEEQLTYSDLDVSYLSQIKELQIAELKIQNQVQILDLENNLTPVVASMEINGIGLDKEKWLALADIAKEKTIRFERELKEEIFSRLDLHTYTSPIQVYDLLSIPYKKTKKSLAELNITLDFDFYKEKLLEEYNVGSNKQLLRALQLLGFEDLKSTSDGALNDLDTDDDIIEMIKRFRSEKKLVNSFGENFIRILNPITGKIHTQFNQLGGRSGRFSSGGGEDTINLQNIVADPEYRHCFIADTGWVIVGGDFSQEEYRLAGSVSKEPVITEAYKNGSDMHTSTAAMFNKIPLAEVTKPQRNAAKPINFSILYGTTAYGMAKKQKCTKQRAQEIIDTFYKGYPVLAKFQHAFQEKVIEKGYSVTLLGRKRFFEKKGIYPSVKEREKELGKVRRWGFNHLIQGCLPPDTRILTNRGWIPIIEFKQESDLVWTGEKWATAILVDKGEDTRIRLHLSDGRYFDCDTRHKLLVQEGVFPTWEKVSNIVGKTLIRDTNVQWGRPYKEIEDWYWAGRMVGDGSFSPKNWTLVFGKKDIDNGDMAKFIFWLERQFPTGGTNSTKGYGIAEEPTYSQVYGYTGKMKALWEGLGLVAGLKSKTKRIPAVVFTLDYERRLAFFDGYFGADGHKRKNKNHRKITSVNHPLLEDTLRLLQTLGITGKINKAQHKEGYTWYELGIHLEPQKLCVTKVENLGTVERMYTLSVNSLSHSFSSEGVISKNTGAEIVKLSLCRIFYENPFGENLKIILTVHDEIECMVKEEYAEEAKAFMKKIMEEEEQKFLGEIPALADLFIESYWAH